MRSTEQGGLTSRLITPVKAIVVINIFLLQAQYSDVSGEILQSDEKVGGAARKL